MEEQIWARSVIGDKAKDREKHRERKRLHEFAHPVVYSFSSFQCQRPDWKARLVSSLPLSSPPPLSSAPLPSLTAHDFFNLSFYFQEITSGSAELTFCPLVFPFPLLLSSLYHLAQLFPICPGLPAVHLVKERTANQGDSDQYSAFFPPSFVSFVFMFHLRPASACESFTVFCYTRVSLHLCFFLPSLP